MATIITHNIGAAPNDGSGDTLRQAFADVNSNFAAVNAELITATADTATNTAAIAALGTLANLNTVGTAQIDNNSVTLAKLLDINTSSFLGRATAATGDPEVLTAAQARTILNVADGATANAGALADLNTVGTAQIDNNAVTLAKLADIATASFIGRTTAATGDPEVLTAAQARIILNVADGATANVGALADLNTVGTAQIDNSAVTTAKIADANVTTVKIADLNVTEGKLAAGAVTAAKLALNAVATGNIINLNVTTDKLAADAVTAAKLADDAVVTANIVNLNVTEAKLAASAVATAKIADNAVTAAKIATALDERTGTLETINNADHAETIWLTNAGSTVDVQFQTDIAEGTEVTVVNRTGGDVDVLAGSHTVFGDTVIPQNQAASILVGTTISGSNRDIYVAAAS